MFSQLVLPLRDQRSISLEADFAEETAHAYHRENYEFHDIDVILLEGIFLLKRQFQSYYDASFWIDCAFETALERALRRSQEGLAPAETVRAYQSIYFPAQRIHIRQDDPMSSATAIVINDPRINVTA
jgi:uridine kinase